jgi:putative membrane protein
MIVRPRPHWLHLLFVRRGSLVHRILPQMLLTYALAGAVVLLHGQLFHWKVTLTSTPFSLMGVALAIFLGFRINASYDRYWEGRKLWGAVLVESRNLTRLALSLPGTNLPTLAQPQPQPFVLGLIGFAHAMRNQLREQPAQTGLAGLLPPALIERCRSALFPPTLVLQWLTEYLRHWREQGGLDSHGSTHMLQSLDQLSAALGGCERIARTPLPFTYSVILHRTVYLYCLLLPFGLVDTIGLMTPLVVGFVAYTFFALEALSDEIEEPFGLMPNDLPLDALVAGIEASLRELLGETPAALPRPDRDFILR